MGVLQDFTIDQLAGSIALILGSLGGLLLIIWKSRCKKINCCYMLQCDREVNDNDDEPKVDLDKQKREIENKKLNDRILLNEEMKRLALIRDKPNITADTTPRSEVSLP
tara:strand:+ start:1033 stop:1359 length:327 start_codon:yes stop_codon:yes gene_type:complete